MVHLGLHFTVNKSLSILYRGPNLNIILVEAWAQYYDEILVGLANLYKSGLLVES